MHPGGDGFRCKLRVPMEVGIGHFIHRTLNRVDSDLPNRADNHVVGHLSAYAASRIVPDNPALLHADSWAYVLALPDIKKASPDPLRVERVEGIHVELGDTLTNRTWASGHADVDLHLGKAILLPGKVKKKR